MESGRLKGSSSSSVLVLKPGTALPLIPRLLHFRKAFLRPSSGSGLRFSPQGNIGPEYTVRGVKLLNSYFGTVGTFPLTFDETRRGLYFSPHRVTTTNLKGSCGEVYPAMAP
jgi:hypothetical protein